jgi:hypothetical protein
MRIVLFPVIVVNFMLSLEFGIINFIYNLVSTPCEYLEAWVNEKRGGVHWLSEAVIFCVTLPFIFSLRVMISVFSVIYALLWLVHVACTYITSLGGVRWQPYIIDAKFEPTYSWSNVHNTTVQTVYCGIVSGLTTIVIILALLLETDILSLDGYYSVSNAHSIIAGITAVGVFVGIPLCFAKKDLKAVENDKNFEQNKETAAVEDPDALPDL